MTAKTSAHIEDLRQHLLSTLFDLRNRDNPMDVERARAVAQVAAVLVDTARVENDYIKITGQDRSTFLDGQDAPMAALPNGIVSTTRHLMGR